MEKIGEVVVWSADVCAVLGNGFLQPVVQYVRLYGDIQQGGQRNPAVPQIKDLVHIRRNPVCLPGNQGKLHMLALQIAVSGVVNVKIQIGDARLVERIYRLMCGGIVVEAGHRLGARRVAFERLHPCPRKSKNQIDDAGVLPHLPPDSGEGVGI